MKKIIAFLLVVSLTATIAIGGTLAYLTDRDSEANVFTVGNVEIDLEEDFEQGAELIPGVNIEKKPTVTNVGPNDAWVWVEIAIPSALNNTTSASNNALHFNMSAESVADGLWNWWDGADYSEDAYYIRNETIDEVEYDVYVVQYETALKAGETTAEPVIYKVYLDKHLDIDPEGNWALVDGGNVTKIDWNSDEDGAPVIYVSAYAMQTGGLPDSDGDGVETVYDAYDAYNKQWTTEGGENNGLEYGQPASLVATADELVEALENGEDVILNGDIKIDPANMSNAYGTTGINIKNGQTINGNGHTLDIQGAGGTWDSGINTTGGTIKDLTVTGSFRGIFVNHNSTHSEPVILDNVTIDGTTYTISCDQGMNQTLTATDCTFNGWTSFAATLGEATFVDCEFGEGNGYAYCRPYAPTAFVGCAFEAGYEMDPRAAVTFENCTLDGAALTADNLATLVTSNIANATIK